VSEPALKSIPAPAHTLSRAFQRRRSPLVLAAGVLLMGLAGCGRGANGGPGGATPVTVVTLKAAPVELTRELPGRTVPFLVADVRPQATGIVRARLFREGAAVRAGQALYQLDDTLYRAQFESARAALAKAEAAHDVARLAAQRADELVRTHAISAQDHDNAVAAERQAAAEVDAEKAALETSRVNLAYTRITSPIAGRIGKSAVTAGALVIANQTAPLATVQQLDPMYVEVSQASSEWLRLKEDIDAGNLQPGGAGSHVTVLLEDGRRYAEDGRLEFADVTVDTGTGSFAVRAVVPNPQETLLPGMYVRAVLRQGTRPAGLLVPQVAVIRDPKGGATALVVGDDGKVAVRSVAVSLAIGDRWLVESGLKSGERVVVEGLQKIRPGDVVQPSEAAQAGAAGK
jgi:membrane fusion protein (multidrug efflux system)